MIRAAYFFLTVFLLIMVLPAVSYATGSVKVGDTIPHDLALKDSKGKLHSFDDLKGAKGLTLVFIRSAEWCPFCQKQLAELSDNAEKFKDSGYPVVTVSYDPVEQLAKYATKNNPKITLLSDPASASIRAFGILNEANAKGTFSYGIPHPGVYIVSKDKKVQAMFFKDDYTKRPSAKELLAKIAELNPPPAPSLDEMGEDPILPGEEVIITPEKITEPVVVPDEAGSVPVMSDDIGPVDSMPQPTSQPSSPSSSTPVVTDTPAPAAETMQAPPADFEDFDLPPMPDATTAQ